jgi:hypothetical protein
MIFLLQSEEIFNIQVYFNSFDIWNNYSSCFSMQFKKKNLNLDRFTISVLDGIRRFLLTSGPVGFLDIRIRSAEVRTLHHQAKLIRKTFIYTVS